MATIEKRRQRRKDGSQGPLKYRVRYVDPHGDERSKTFDKWRSANAFANKTEADKDRGAWIDPRNGRITFREYFEQWQAVQMHAGGTRDQITGTFGRHVLPTFGDKQLTQINRALVQAWVKSLSDSLSPATVVVIFSWVRAVFKSAVFDERIAKSPCFEIRLPKSEEKEVIPPTTEEVQSLLAAAPPWMRGPIFTAAGSGLRQGEALGLGLHAIDFLRARSLRVERQLTLPNKGLPYLGPPKTESSKRTVPLAEVVLNGLSEHLVRFPVTHEWGLVFTNDRGECIRRNRFSENWLAAMTAAKLVIPHPDDPKKVVPKFTFHGLRHYYASLLIRHGESVVTVQKRLGHKTPEETLKTYLHLWPDSDERSRAAVGEVWRSTPTLAVAAE